MRERAGGEGATHRHDAFVGACFTATTLTLTLSRTREIVEGKPTGLVDTTTEVFGKLASGGFPIKGYGGGGGAKSRFVCGYFGCERRAERLFLAGLPPLMKINVRSDPAGQWIEHSIRHLAQEAGDGKPGHGMLLSKMAEALFVETLRRYMEQLTPEQAREGEAPSERSGGSSIDFENAGPEAG